MISLQIFFDSSSREGFRLYCLKKHVSKFYVDLIMFFLVECTLLFLFVNKVNVLKINFLYVYLSALTEKIC